MSPKCIVPSCKNNRGDSGVHCYTVMNACGNKERLRQWRRALKLRRRIKKHEIICNAHFVTTDFIYGDLLQLEMGVRKVAPRLLPHALPCIAGSEDACESSEDDSSDDSSLDCIQPTRSNRLQRQEQQTSEDHHTTTIDRRGVFEEITVNGEPFAVTVVNGEPFTWSVVNEEPSNVNEPFAAIIDSRGVFEEINVNGEPFVGTVIKDEPFNVEQVDATVDSGRGAFEETVVKQEPSDDTIVKDEPFDVTSLKVESEIKCETDKQ